MSAPIILNSSDNGYYLIAGNTRLMVAKALGVRPKVWLVEDYQSKKPQEELLLEVVNNQIIVDSIEYIFDGQQYFYANESTPEELMQFVETLNTDQFNKIEEFFDNLPVLNKTVVIKCSKCGYDHSINVEGLENFFG